MPGSETAKPSSEEVEAEVSEGLMSSTLTKSKEKEIEQCSGWMVLYLRLMKSGLHLKRLNQGLNMIIPIMIFGKRNTHSQVLQLMRSMSVCFIKLEIC